MVKSQMRLSSYKMVMKPNPLFFYPEKLNEAQELKFTPIIIYLLSAKLVNEVGEDCWLLPLSPHSGFSYVSDKNEKCPGGVFEFFIDKCLDCFLVLVSPSIEKFLFGHRFNFVCFIRPFR